MAKLDYIIAKDLTIGTIANSQVQKYTDSLFGQWEKVYEAAMIEWTLLSLNFPSLVSDASAGADMKCSNFVKMLKDIKEEKI